MKPTQWVGLITNASPHIIPPGATVDQVNLTTRVAGQLTVRGGMRVLPRTGGAAQVRDIHGYMSGGYYYAVYLTDGGDIAWERAPQFGVEPGAPAEPTLSASGKQAATSYVQRCKSALEDI